MPHPAVYAITIGAAVVVGIGAAILGYFVYHEGEHRHSSRYTNKTDSDFEYIDSGTKCTICIETILSTEDYEYRKCGHKFHRACLNTWLRFNNTCPNCRK